MKYFRADTAVIGGGAAGLCAAVSCAGKGKDTVLIERQSRTGRKLLATGNGRCNISNRRASPRYYHGDQRIIEAVLSGFSPEDAEGFFLSLGVLLREDGEGRMYPYSNQAASVLQALQRECDRLKVRTLCDTVVTELKPTRNGFVVRCEDAEITAGDVIMATGSQAAPSLGANDSGYQLLAKAGCHPTPLFPALCPIGTREKYKSLKGVRAKGTVTLTADRKPLKESAGEIQFTDHGLSGICVFDLSRYCNEWFRTGHTEGQRFHQLLLTLDLLPDRSFPEVLSYLSDFRKLLGTAPADCLLSGALHRNLSAVIARSCGIAERPCSSLTGTDMKKLVSTAKNFRFTPLPCESFASAQVSAGGFGAETVDPETLMVKKLPHLYLCGELLNVDGDCGGFNLHFAVGSALRAAAQIKS